MSAPPSDDAIMRVRKLAQDWPAQECFDLEALIAAAAPEAPPLDRPIRCEHHACRCARAAELAEMADQRGGEAGIELLVTAVRLLAGGERVECRRIGRG